MRNNCAQFFGLYLVFITLFLCGVVIGLYYIQQGNALNSLVSPRAVLEVQDGLKLFEMREVGLIRESLVEANEVEDFGTDDFVKKFREVFISGVLADDDMTEFIFGDLTLKGQNVEDDARLKSRNFFENGLYSEGLTSFEDGKLVFTREIIGKETHLIAEDKVKINFPVKFLFEFGQKYLISLVDDGFIVEVV